MISRHQIDELHDRLGTQESLPEYLRALAEVGVIRFESFVCDGHTEFVGAGGERVTTSAHHAPLDIADTSDKAQALECLHGHEQGLTSYEEMSAGLAASGVEKWVADTCELTMAYYDSDGRIIHSEHL